MADFVRTEVHGVRELVSAFRRLDRNLPEESAKELQGIGNRVTHEIQAKVPIDIGRARGSFRVRKKQTSITLAAGGARAPYYQWLDFGGRVGRNKSVTRPYMKSGRYIYPTIAERGPEIKSQVENALVKLARKAGFRVD